MSGRLETSPVAARIRACEAVLFDLDDTLYLERAYVRSGGRAVARRLSAALGLDPARVERELLTVVARDPVGDPFGCWLRRRNLEPASWMPEILTWYRSHRPAIRLEPGVERLLTRLARSCRLGLVTDGRFAQQRLKVEALGLDRWFDAVVLSDELGRDAWKPSVKPYRRALDLLGVAADRAVFVGDNPAKDFLGARRAGMPSIRWRRRGGLHVRREPEHEEARPDLEASSLRGLSSILGRRPAPRVR